ncbi:MAG: hypothetical protein NZ828_03230 [Alphaproteobacteria bacterium]|nr:hypothetical protein [Alphaproteobacteria bacterium]
MQNNTYIKLLLISLIGFILTTSVRNAHAAQDTLPLNAEGWYDSLWVSPDGKMMLFMYARYNFFPAIIDGKAPKLYETNTAPINGHHSNDINPWDDSDLYLMIKQDNGQWSGPHNLPTNDARADCCAMIAGDEMFFQKGTDIYVSKFENGTWQNATKLSINSYKVDTNPHYDAFSKTLYWASDRGGNYDIWQAQRLDQNDWSAPEPIKGDVNTAAKEDQPFIHNGKLYFSRDGYSGNAFATLNKKGEWAKVKRQSFGSAFYESEVSYSADGQQAWFVAGDLKTQKLFFMTTTQNPTTGEWSKPIKILD